MLAPACGRLREAAARRSRARSQRRSRTARRALRFAMRSTVLVLTLAAAAAAAADDAADFESVDETFDDSAHVEVADETFDMTRAEFLEQFSDLDDARAERLWRAYEQQRDAGDLEFHYDMGEQRAKFRVPLTHAIAPYLFPQLVDAIEGAHAVLLDAYRSMVPASQRAWVAAALDVADTYFVIEILIALLLGAAAFDFARGRRTAEAADGARRKDE